MLVSPCACHGLSVPVATDIVLSMRAFLLQSVAPVQNAKLWSEPTLTWTLIQICGGEVAVANPRQKSVFRFADCWCGMLRCLGKRF